MIHNGRTVRLILLWFCTSTSFTVAEILPVKEPEHPILDCAVSVHKPRQYLNILIIYSESTQSYVDYLLRNITSSMHVGLYNVNVNTDNILQSELTYTSYVILVSSVQEYRDTLTLFYKSRIWNARGQYVVILLTQTVDVLEVMFKISWEKYIVNVNVLLHSEDDYAMYTYYPYYKQHCGDTFHFGLLARCNETVVDPFPDKIPLDMHQCPISIAVNIYPPLVLDPYLVEDNAGRGGSEVSLVHNIVHHMNMHPTVQAGQGLFSEQLENGSYRGVLAHVSKGHAHLGYGTVFPNITYFQDMDTTVFYSYVEISWVVPTALPSKPWANLVIIFQHTLWYTIIGALLVNAGIWWICGRLIKRDLADYTRMDQCFFNSWLALLQGSVKLPLTAPMRLLVIFWVLFTLLLASLYQSQLVSVMMQPIYERQISTKSELVESSLDIIILEDFSVRLAHSNKPVDKELIQKGRLVTMAEQMAISSSYQRKHSFMTNLGSFKYLLPRNYSYRSGNPAMYLFKQVEFGNPISMFTIRGYPLLDRINQLIQCMVESGKFSKWIKDVEFYRPKVGTTETDQPEKFTLEKFLGAFLVLAIGYSVALLAFIAEILTNKFQN